MLCNIAQSSWLPDCAKLETSPKASAKLETSTKANARLETLTKAYT